MSEVDDKLNSILSNPAMMQQIMALAQTLNQSEPQKQKPESAPPPQQPLQAPLQEGSLNPNLLSKVAGLMQPGSIDKNQESLLKALSPYLSKQKLQKLERAMYAAKMAGVASEMVNIRGLSPFARR